MSRRIDTKKVTFTQCESSSSDSSTEYEDVLERKIEELSRHLAEEKQVSRREKIHVARLHRELARYKGDKEVKEKDTLQKDLDQERMLRADAEKKLRELTVESEHSQSRFHQLQSEFQKMDQAVSQMMQFKTKIDQLKQEKSSLSVQYENNLQKYNSHISSLERENIMLSNDVKKFEQQMSSGTDQERTKLLLERLKVLEAENLSLVLENEQQRQQYEKCLDEIANQVVQALLAQKALREECVKLQTRVQDLEFQNKELNHLFQQKMKYSSDTFLQSLPSSQTVSSNTLCEVTSCYNSVCSLPASSSVSMDTMHLTPESHLTPEPHLSQQMSTAHLSQHMLMHNVVQTCVTQTHTTSTESLHSIGTINNCDFNKSQSRNHGNKSCGSPDCSENCDNVHCRTKIETEFPATNSSPKMKHVSIVDRANEKAKQRSSSTSSLHSGNKPRTFRTNSTASIGKSKIVPPGVISQSTSNVSSNQVEVAVQIHQSEASTKKRSVSQPEHINKTTGNQSKTGLKPSRTELSKSTSKLNPKLQKSSSSTSIPTKRTSKSQSSLPQPSASRLPQKKHEQDSGRKNSGCISQVNSQSRVPKTVPKTQGCIQPKLNQTSIEREITPTNNQPARVPSFPNGQYFYDYSDEDSDINRPISGFSNGSTISINEILDDDDDTDTLLDADFTAEKFAFFETPPFLKPDKKKKEKCKQKPVFSSLRGKPDIVRDTEHSEQRNKQKSPRSHRRRSSLPHSHKPKPNRPSSLVLNSKDKLSLKQGYSSSSLESSDSDENWSPQFARQYQLKLYHVHNKSGSSESSSMSGSLSEKVPLKSSQEIASTVNENTTDSNIYRDVIVVKNNQNVTSQLKKKGPPPPVPKKPPTAGRRSPGIIMGVQSPGLRNKALTIYNAPDTGLLKPHEFKTGVFENVETSVKIPSQTHKYMSSDSSFESVKNEKVERSGSKDDGYSTMSSDIQPEMLEKFNDSSLKRDIVFRSDFQIRNDMTVMNVTESSHKFIGSSPVDMSCESSVVDRFVSCGTSPMDSSVSSNLTKELNIQDKNIGHSSLGRVKAMKHLFEAECHKQTDQSKRFPLRKSFSVDSKLGHKQSHENLNRRSLGDDVKLNIPDNDLPVLTPYTKERDSEQGLENKGEINLSNEAFTSQNIKNELTEKSTNQSEQTYYASKLDHVTLSTDHVTSTRSHMTSDRNSVYHMLNQSEENFLSDIPEEKEDYGEMFSASNERLLDYPVCPQISNNISQLSTNKHYWSSTFGLCRFLSDSDLDRIKNLENKTCIGRPLERSLSLTSLSTKLEFSTNMKLAPKLHRSCCQSLISEVSVMEKFQDFMKEHILKQMAQTIDDVSDDDLQNYSFAQLLAKKQKENFLAQSFGSKFGSPCPGKNRSETPTDSFSSCFHGNDQHFSTNEERSDETGRQSSKESSPMVEKPSKFRSDYYSLCMVGSNRSLFSGSNEGESEQISTDESHSINCKDDPLKCRQCIKTKNTEEFDCISRQLQSLSKTVNALQESLTCVDSCDSDIDSNEDHSHMFVSSNSDFHADGYQWIEDDEFYLTPCGGELIMGSSPFSDTGACAEWINEYADDTSCNDEFEFYGNFAGERVDVNHFVHPMKEEEEIPNTQQQNKVMPPQHNSPVHKVKNSPKSHDSYSKQKALKSLRTDGHVRHHSDGHLHINGLDSRVSKNVVDLKDSGDSHKMSDPQVRAAMLDAMVHLSGASMDSLDDNIGVDHVMCSRLLVGDKRNTSTTTTRSAVDLSQFFIRYERPEEEAVAAFDFLDDISPKSDITEHMSDIFNSQSNNSTQTELTNQSRDKISLLNHNIETQPVLKSTDTKGKPQVTTETEKLKTKPAKPEKKFFNFTRSKSTKSVEPVKESKLPKKIKTKDHKETLKEKSRIPKFRSNEKIVKQLNTKVIQDVKSSKILNSNEQFTKLNNKIVDKL